MLTLTKYNFNKYTSSNPYYFEEKVNKIRVETSKVKDNSYLFVYQIKEIDGSIGDKYETEPATDIPSKYELIQIPENADGTMSLEIVIDENGNTIANNTTYVKYYYRKLNFNLSIEKKVNNIIVNGRALNVNGKLGKVEIAKSEVTSSKVEISYSIKVTNKGELPGKATILENIPSGTIMKKENNPMWEIGGTTATMITEEIAPGETKEYEVILEWTNNGKNNGKSRMSFISSGSYHFPNYLP